MGYLGLGLGLGWVRVRVRFRVLFLSCRAYYVPFVYGLNTLPVNIVHCLTLIKYCFLKYVDNNFVFAVCS